MLDIKIEPLTMSISNITLVSDFTIYKIDLGPLNFSERRALISDLAAIIQELCE